MQDLWDISLRFVYTFASYMWKCVSVYSPWSDKYENIHQSRYTEQVKAIIALKSQQIKSEAISYSKVSNTSPCANKGCYLVVELIGGQILPPLCVYH